MSDDALIVGNLVGFYATAGEWHKIVKRLIAQKRAALLSAAKTPAEKAKIDQLTSLRNAPQGSWKLISEFKAASDFLTVARRALLNNNKLYHSNSELSEKAVEVEFDLFGVEGEENEGRKLGIKRKNKEIDGFMSAFVEFGLFALINPDRKIYRLTDEGEKAYDALADRKAARTPATHSITLHSSDVSFSAGSYSRLGATGWGHPQITLTYNFK